MSCAHEPMDTPSVWLEHHLQLVQHVTNGSLLHTVCDKKRHENGRARRPDTQRGVGEKFSASIGNSERSVHRQHETQRACRRDQSDRGNVESNMASAALGLEPSISGCIGLSALGGALEVMSTMVLAYPEHRAKAGNPFSQCCMRFAVVVNLLLMAVASVAYIVGSWFGPVSLSVPVVMASKLLFNMLVVGVVLRMERFDKNQRVGTYVIAFAIVALPEVGPQPIADQDPVSLIQMPLSLIWSAFLLGTMVITIVAMVVLSCLKKKYGEAATPRPKLLLAVLVTAQVTSAVIGTSVGKIFAVAQGTLLAVCIGLSVVTAVVNVVSLMMAASSVNQGIFVPLQTCATLGVNMLTGLLIWEDWRVVTQWFAYVALYWLMALGIYMLTDADVLDMYKRRKQARIAKKLFSFKDIGDVARGTAIEEEDEEEGGGGGYYADVRTMSPEADAVGPALAFAAARAGRGSVGGMPGGARGSVRARGSVVTRQSIWQSMLVKDEPPRRREFQEASAGRKWKAAAGGMTFARAVSKAAEAQASHAASSPHLPSSSATAASHSSRAPPPPLLSTHSSSSPPPPLLSSSRKQPSRPNAPPAPPSPAAPETPTTPETPSMYSLGPQMDPTLDPPLDMMPSQQHMDMMRASFTERKVSGDL